MEPVGVERDQLAFGSRRARLTGSARAHRGRVAHVASPSWPFRWGDSRRGEADSRQMTNVAARPNEGQLGSPEPEKRPAHAERAAPAAVDPDRLAKSPGWLGPSRLDGRIRSTLARRCDRLHRCTSASSCSSRSRNGGQPVVEPRFDRASGHRDARHLLEAQFAPVAQYDDRALVAVQAEQRPARSNHAPAAPQRRPASLPPPRRAPRPRGVDGLAA